MYNTFAVKNAGPCHGVGSRTQSPEKSPLRVSRRTQFSILLKMSLDIHAPAQKNGIIPVEFN